MQAKDLEAYFKVLQGDEEAEEVFSHLTRTFQLEIEGVGEYVLRPNSDHSFDVEDGRLERIDFRESTLVKMDQRSFFDLLAGRVTPGKAYFDSLLSMSGMMSSMGDNHGFLRLWRRAQELNR